MDEARRPDITRIKQQLEQPNITAEQFDELVRRLQVLENLGKQG